MGQIYRTLEALRARNYSFHLLRKQLQEFGMSTAKGWPSLLEKYQEEPAQSSLIEEESNDLGDVLLDNIRYGARAVSIYDLDAEVASTLAQHAHEWVSPDSPYRSAYPMPLTQSELSTAAYGPFISAAEHINKHSRRIVICTKRYTRSREEIVLSNLNQNVRDSLTGYEELFGIRCSHTQGYDSIQIHPASNRLEIHIDLSHHLTEDEILQTRNHHISLIEELSSTILGYRLTLGVARNFLPLIKTLYDQKDGAVPHLGHATATASIKEERMRRKTEDLRTEPFHQGGLAGVDNLTDLYSITKTWTGVSTEGSVLSLTIPGHFRLLGSPNARISYAVISNCTNEADFNFVMSKLL